MTTEIATIIAAILAFITSVISSILSGYSIHETKKGNKDNIESNKEISREVQAAENKRNERQIDANIVWNARVEWIQNVRRVTAEFIADCYKYMRAYDDSSKESLNLVVEEKKLLLILYFGPDGDGIEQNKFNNILDKQTNNAKNDSIVELINIICVQIKKYHEARKKLNDCYEKLGECARCENENENKQYFCENNDYGDKFSDEQCASFKENIHLEETKNASIIQELHKNLNKLSEAMRIYLKIEWNSAKKRDKC